jgi:hypothetical protein
MWAYLTGLGIAWFLGYRFGREMQKASRVIDRSPFGPVQAGLVTPSNVIPLRRRGGAA